MGIKPAGHDPAPNVGTLTGEIGRKGADGVVFGNQNLKIGAPVELEGSNFRVIGSVTGLQVGRS